MNDTPRTTTTPVTPKQRRILRDLIAEHREDIHVDIPRTGCAACLLSGALDQDGGE